VIGRHSPPLVQGDSARLSVMLESLLSSPRVGNVVAVGVDLTHVPEVQRSVDVFGSQYLDRIFTPGEQAQSAESSDPTPHLAARFAAKEATIKVLSVEDAIPPWTSIEVRRDACGASTLHLTGTAARFALNRGIDSLLVSLSHESEMAIAVVVALTNTERIPLNPQSGQQQIPA
jgi:holo-[acyl-carrier protein] synthase